jgi:2-polyprenyl-3-methyl-5-hydroxy-6-metoxy-1,4-benzoquinol methylase
MSDTYRTVVDPTAVNNPHSYAIQLVGAGHRVLEVGCSVGHVTQHLVAAGNTVVGVEIDADAAQEARAWASAVHVVDLDLTPLTTIESGTFDVIVLGDVLEHLRDPAATLRDLVSLLEPDGRVIISVPHVGFIDVRLMLLEGTWAYQRDGLLDRTHLRWFTKSSLRDLLAEVGLVATRVERVTHAIGASQLPVNADLHAPDVIRFIEADPEAHTYQFVVEAARHGASVLDDTDIAWPNLADERATLVGELDVLRSQSDELRTQNAAMRTELDAWHNARIVRWTAPLRTLWGAIRQRRSAR